MAWPRKAIWNRDIDKSADETLVGVLARKTGLPVETVITTTLAAYEGWLYERHNPYGNTLWIMPIGIYHRTRRNFGLQFCAQCLMEDAEAYWRRKWRLAFVTICPDHRLVLQDRCPKCGAAVNFHRNELGNRWQIVTRSLVLCYSCSFDLRATATFTGRAVTDEEVYFQQMLLDGLKQGWVEVRMGERVYSHLYFTALHQVIRVLATGKRAKTFREATGRECGYSRTFTPSFEGKNREIERLPVSERRKLLDMARYLLGEWPNRFVSVCTRSRAWSSALLRDLEPAPFWYWSVIHDHLYRTSYRASDEEIRSAIIYINKTGGQLHQKAVSKLLGAQNVFRKRKSPELLAMVCNSPA